MAATDSTTQSVELSSADEAATKTVHKRYEGLAMIRTKAIKGKGAWYWAHLEPILVQNSDTGSPKSVKLDLPSCDFVWVQVQLVFLEMGEYPWAFQVRYG